MPREKPVKELTDEEVVHCYRNSHDTAYVGELYLRYTHLVFAVCLKYLKDKEAASDATMQIFEKLITDLKKHNIQVFKPWLYTVVRNHCMMQFRSETTRQNQMKVVYKEPADMESSSLLHPDETEERELEKDWVIRNLENGIENLKAHQQLCLKQFYFEDQSYKQIAANTGFSLQEVKTHIQNGKRNLKIYLEQQNEQKG